MFYRQSVLIWIEVYTKTRSLRDLGKEIDILPHGYE